MTQARARGTQNGAYRHGMDGTPTYRAWINMKARCLNPNHRAFPRYGGRGITVCERWLDFRNFLADMGVCPTGLSLDRVDNDGNYEPGNCRWTTAAKQARNTRQTVLTAEAVDVIRTTALSSASLAEMFGVSARTIRKVRSGDRWKVVEQLGRRRRVGTTF